MDRTRLAFGCLLRQRKSLLFLSMRTLITCSCHAMLTASPRTICISSFFSMRLSSHSDEMLAPEIRPQINNLPSSQRHQNTHGPQTEPLDPLVRALIRISELHLSCPQIIHLLYNLLRALADPPQFRFHGFQLLASLDSAPVLGVRADIDVQLDTAVDRLGRRRAG